MGKVSKGKGVRTVGLDLWFREDIQRTLNGLARAAARYNGEYAAGYLDALGDMATSFGVTVPRRAVPEATWHIIGNEHQVVVYDENGNAGRQIP